MLSGWLDGVVYRNSKKLAERGEYRSAVIESSAALEVVVEQKIVEKMLARGRSQIEIDNYLHRTETKFYERWDLQLESTQDNLLSTTILFFGQPLILSESLIDIKLPIHIRPDDRKTEEIINDFETAIKYIQSLYVYRLPRLGFNATGVHLGFFLNYEY